MNREIKFRAWSTEYNQMIENDFVQVQGNGIFMAYQEHNSKWLDHSCILMQYTGLNDKNGKEIYEGDILLMGQVEYLKVFFNTSMAAFDLEYAGGDCESMVMPDGWHHEDYEIVGNIYQNPDLLT